MARLPVKKTYKLFIGGAFPRSESGRTYEAQGQNVARASRKDARDAVVAARAAQPKWAGGDRVQPRPGALPDRRDDGGARSPSSPSSSTGRDEVERAIDRWVWYAGFADKLAQVLGVVEPGAGPYFNFTVPEPTGVVGVVAPGGAAAARPRLADRAGARRRQRGRRGRLGGEPARRGRAGRGARDERPSGRRRQPAHGPPRRARARGSPRTWT